MSGLDHRVLALEQPDVLHTVLNYWGLLKLLLAICLPLLALLASGDLATLWSAAAVGGVAH
jgi:hypothetical protein